LATKYVKRLLWVAIPVGSLAIASFSSATQRTLHSVLWAPSFANGIVVFNCNHTENGRRYHFNAAASAVDACGTSLVESQGDSFTTGTTASTEFDDQTKVGPCGKVTQHRAHLYEDIMAPAGHLFIQQGTGADSGCWNSNVNTGQCMSASAATNFNSSTSASGGSCSNHVIQAVSTGTTP
jgi:hypothetical protein